jgi:hypothetical protein
MIDLDLEQELGPNLNAGEKLVWVGKPKGGIVFRRSDIFLIPFSLFWCGFIVFWETSVIESGAPFFFCLFGIPFMFAGLYISIGRFMIDSKKRNKTVYGLTKDRIIILSGLFSRDFKSLNIKALPDLTLNQKEDGSGTITLGVGDLRSSMMQGMDWPGMKQPPRLEFIEHVQEVYSKIIAFQQQS